MDKAKITDLEIDLLLLFYTFSDQFGNVDIPQVSSYANEQYGISIPLTPFVLEQQHIDLLVERGLLPDSKHILSTILAKQIKPKAVRRNPKKL